MQQYANLCKGCFAEIEPGRTCASCGWSEANAKPVDGQLVPGTLLRDRYLVGGPLGRGGFSITYLGWDTKLQRRRAVKEYFPAGVVTRGGTQASVSILSGQTETYQDGIQKYLTEARLLARFEGHPCIVYPLDFFEENGTAYLVMEYLDGETLRGYVRRQGGRIPYAHALDFLSPVLHALATVHKQGILHRDVSPDNIFLTVQNETKLLDFGAARQQNTGQQANMTVILREHYAPPEQYTKAGDQGPWTDIYAFAATFYFALVGESPQSAIDRVMNDELLMPSQRGVDIPGAAEAILLRCLAIRYRERPQQIEELMSVLLGTPAPGSAASTTVRQGATTRPSSTTSRRVDPPTSAKPSTAVASESDATQMVSHEEIRRGTGPRGTEPAVPAGPSALSLAIASATEKLGALGAQIAAGAKAATAAALPHWKIGAGALAAIAVIAIGVPLLGGLFGSDPIDTEKPPTLAQAPAGVNPEPTPDPIPTPQPPGGDASGAAPDPGEIPLQKQAGVIPPSDPDPKPDPLPADPPKPTPPVTPAPKPEPPKLLDVTIDLNVAGAEVSIDGGKYGPLKSEGYQLSAGSHNFQFRTKDKSYKPLQKTEVIDANGGAQRLSFTMEPAVAEKPQAEPKPAPQSDTKEVASLIEKLRTGSKTEKTQAKTRLEELARTSVVAQEKLGELYVKDESINYMPDDAKALQYYRMAFKGGSTTARAPLLRRLETGQWRDKVWKCSGGMVFSTKCKDEPINPPPVPTVDPETNFMSWMATQSPGKGSLAEQQEAFGIYAAAAKRGDAEGMEHVGYMMVQGHGVKSNLFDAFLWFLKSANKGHAPAQYTVGKLYMLGEGFKQNKEAGECWLKRAAAGKLDRARKALEGLGTLKPGAALPPAPRCDFRPNGDDPKALP